MQVDVLIVGQGICGSFLSYELYQGKKLSFAVIDRNDDFSSSKVASGLINPVTGRIVATSWLIDTLLPFCKEKYQAMESALDIPVFSETTITAIAETAQMQEAYEKRLREKNSFVIAADEANIKDYFIASGKSYGISPVFLVDLNAIIHHWRKILTDERMLITEAFNEAELSVSEDAVYYKNIVAGKIIYAGGVDSFYSKYWKNLPYAVNKGQALIVDIPALPRGKVYKLPGVTLVPWSKNLWWAGSTYERVFRDNKPDPAFYAATKSALRAILRVPFTIVDHLASIRPASVERRPFVGFHPKYNNVGILNGMGTKGCSLGPYFASQLNDHLNGLSAIDPLADVSRFSSVLMR